jgi:hypothetical protein
MPSMDLPFPDLLCGCLQVLHMPTTIILGLERLRSVVLRFGVLSLRWLELLRHGSVLIDKY